MQGLVLPAELCLKICCTSGLLGHSQPPKYFSSRNELLSRGSNPVPDCHGLVFIAWVGLGQLGPGHGPTIALLYIPNLH